VFSGKVYFYHDNAFIKEITTYPYSFTFLGLKKGMHKVTAKYYNESNELVDTASIYFVVKIPGENSLRDSATERLYSTLKYTASIGYPMFGMQMPTTRGYTEGSFNFSWNTSDCKDITGSHPAFHEADFSHYSPIPNDFQKLELMALKEAVKRGAVVGFCWHMGGRYTNNIYVNGDNTNPDAKLVHEIVSDTNRLTNPALDWYLTKYDQIAIPVFKEMGCPIFFRPLHEMTGNWFWWGSVNTPNDVAKLFALTVKYIRSKGVKNVLYVWSPNLSTDFSFYPGDEYVDVIGYDGYQIGVASYASISKVLKDLSTLTDYAYSHNKIAAFTETGLDQTNGYPSIYPDWWTKKLFNPIINHPKAHRLAWIETWCNSGTFWIPYKGCNAKNCDLAVNDFIEFYKYPNTIFENDIPDMYGFKDDLEGGFIYPDSVVLNEGQSLKIFGGTYSKWFLGEKQQWIINNENIGIIDSTGLIEAKNEGNTFIKLMNNNIIIDSIPLIVKKNLSIINRENNNSKCLVFSNPVFSNSFEIQIPENTNGATIELINIQGAIIKKFRTYEKNLQINTKHLNKGIYYVRILLINKSETCKVIIQ